MERTIEGCKKDGNVQQHGSMDPILWVCKLPMGEYCGKRMDFGGMQLCTEPLRAKAKEGAAPQEKKR
ncbi:MAG: hypothetical protein WC717_03490 [Candidatus Micrarchaeia archaeon]|jgi:hypothetical protein